jgi:hypothetical protein
VIVYCVTGDGEPPFYCAAKLDAMIAARAGSVKTPDAELIVERCTLVPMTKAAVLRLINQSGGYVEDSTIVATFVAGKRVKS